MSEKRKEKFGLNQILTIVLIVGVFGIFAVRLATPFLEKAAAPETVAKSAEQKRSELFERHGLDKAKTREEFREKLAKMEKDPEYSIFDVTTAKRIEELRAKVGDAVLEEILKSDPGYIDRLRAKLDEPVLSEAQKATQKRLAELRAKVDPNYGKKEAAKEIDVFELLVAPEIETDPVKERVVEIREKARTEARLQESRKKYPDAQLHEAFRAIDEATVEGNNIAEYESEIALLVERMESLFKSGEDPFDSDAAGQYLASLKKKGSLFAAEGLWAFLYRPLKDRSEPKLTPIPLSET